MLPTRAQASLTLGQRDSADWNSAGSIATGAAPSGTFQISNGGLSSNSASIAVNLNTDSLGTIAANINKRHHRRPAEVSPFPTQTGTSGRQPAAATDPRFHPGQPPRATLTPPHLPTAAHPVHPRHRAERVHGDGHTGQGRPVQLRRAGHDARYQHGGCHRRRRDYQAAVFRDDGHPATTTLNVTQDTSNIIQAVQNFTTAYNAVQDFVTNRTHSPRRPPAPPPARPQGSPPLFGNTTLNEIQQTLCQRPDGRFGDQDAGQHRPDAHGTGDLHVDTAALTNAFRPTRRQYPTCSAFPASDNSRRPVRLRQRQDGGVDRGRVSPSPSRRRPPSRRTRRQAATAADQHGPGDADFRRCAVQHRRSP